ncbi:hypothetical protein TIFTF001_001909 [Ficus carica]|uniref:Uncharacterized protein n=1 Tax=Ficus carica TaxID=3494 RepID=A0AA87Z225_FICCA|nr:hypothetical protein TIFTF001_001909 [Ficus carica]
MTKLDKNKATLVAWFWCAFEDERLVEDFVGVPQSDGAKRIRDTRKRE